MRKILFSMVVCVMALFTSGCSTQVVPPGTVVIVLQADGDSSVHTEGSYMAWGRDRVYFVDTKLKGFTEKMEILCTDNINMSVDVKWVGSFDANKQNVKVIKEKVPATEVKTGDIEGYELSLKKFYDTAMKDIIRASTRAIVAKYSTDEVREFRDKIQADIKKRVSDRLKNLKYPVASTDIMVSNLDYPEEITTQRKAIKNAQLEDEKQAALSVAAIAQAQRAASIARERGKAKIEEAKADAAANNIRSKSLTPQILMVKQWDTLEIIGGREGDLMIVPFEALEKTVVPALTGEAVERSKYGPKG